MNHFICECKCFFIELPESILALAAGFACALVYEHFKPKKK